MEGHIFIRGQIGQEFYNEVDKQLQSPNIKNASELVVHISSPGGSVYAGYTTYHLLRAVGKPITCIIEGEAQSMATFIAMAGDKVIALDPSIYMIHNPSQGLEGDADALQGGSEELRKIEDEMAAAYSRKTGIPIEEIKGMMKKETRMTANDAKKLGFVDEVRTQLKAVAIGRNKQTKKMSKTKGVGEKLVKLLGELVGGEAPTAMDIPLVDGTVLVSDAASEDTINGSNVTINGAPAPDGDYQTADGMVISVTGGIVSNVVDPTDASSNEKIAALEKQLAELKMGNTVPKRKPAPVPAPKVPEPQKQTMEADEKIKALEAEIEAVKQQAAEAADAKAELEKVVKALAQVESELAIQKKKTVGNPAKPSEGLEPIRVPVGFKPSGPNAIVQDATKTFLAQQMTWLHQYYPAGYFDNYKPGGPNAVSVVETNFNYTYPGILTTDLFYKPSLSSPALSDIFTIDQGVSFQKQYNLVPILNKILQPYQGCTTTANTDRVQIYNATLTTKEFRMYEGWCKDDFTQQLTGVYNNLAQEWLKTGEKSFDPAGTPIDTAIMNVLADALRRDIFRRVCFADNSSSDSDYNQFSGLWDRLIDSSGQSNYCVVRANSSLYGGSSLGIGSLAAGVALTNLELVYNKSNDLLKEQFNKATFWVTGSVYDNYVQSLVGTGNVSQAQFEATINGYDGNKTWGGGITYKGIPIRPIRLWDNLLAESDNPLTSTTRHLILLTIKENHMLGVESGGDLNRIDSWYEMKDSKRYYRANMKFGYQYLHCDLQTIAY